MLAETRPDGQDGVATLYQDLIAAWNRRDARGMASLFSEDGEITGFDGSMLSGAGEIELSMARIFADHETPPYIAKVRTIRMVGGDVAVLRAVAGMIPPGAEDLNPALNAAQSLVAVRAGARWQVALFQATPAAFHGRPDAVAALTQELRDYAAGESGRPRV